MRSLHVAALALLPLLGPALAACDTRPGLGDQCRFGCSVYTGECTPDVHECQDGLYCSDLHDVCIEPSAVGEPCGEACVRGAFCGSDGLCQAYGKLGEGCGEACAEGLACGLDGRCQDRGLEGSACDDDGQCGPNLFCNMGATGRFTEGACLPRSQDGGPCTWAPVGNPASAYWWLSNGSLAAYTWRDCEDHLRCEPSGDLPAPGASSVDPRALGCTTAETCGFPGTCHREGTQVTGGACLRNEDCASEHCVIATRPRADAATPGFAACEAAPLLCWDGPWTGRCGPAGSWSPEGTGCVGPNASCDPGLACGQADPTCTTDCEGACRSVHGLPIGAACGEPTCTLVSDGQGHMNCTGDPKTLAPNDALCALGLHCDDATSPPTCAR